VRRFRFVHAADLHLDSPFAGLSGIPAGVREALRQSGFEALNRLVELAVRVQADFVLIAGDVYDSADRSLRAQVRFLNALKVLAERGISAFVVHGNHDPADGKAAALDWPETVHVFPAGELRCIPVVLPGRGHVADVSGISYPTAAVRENYALRFKRESPGEDVYQIGLLHANVDGAADHEDYAPCTLKELAAGGMDYWALGHVHTRQVLHEEPYVVYPGNIQGRSVRETGAKGCYVVDVDEAGHTALTFHSLDAVRWMRTSSSIAGLRTEQELKDRMEVELEAARTEGGGRPVVVRMELTGRGPLHRMLQGGFLQELTEELRLAEAERAGEDYAGGSGGGAAGDFVWIESVKVRTGSDVDREALAASPGFLGDVLRMADGLLGADREQLKRFAEECMAPLLSHPKAGALARKSGMADLDGLDSEAAEEWLKQAVEWLTDQLVDGEEEGA
jgi:DNA repair protein SbcD/Mre11